MSIERTCGKCDYKSGIRYNFGRNYFAEARHHGNFECPKCGASRSKTDEELMNSEWLKDYAEDYPGRTTPAKSLYDIKIEDKNEVRWYQIPVIIVSIILAVILIAPTVPFKMQNGSYSRFVQRIFIDWWNN